MKKETVETRTIVELDLKGYSDAAREIEEHLGALAVAQFNDFIQGQFVTTALKSVGVVEGDGTLATTGDGAIVQFREARTAVRFAQAVQQLSLEHNADLTVPVAKRWFRIGVATGDLAITQTDGEPRRYAGSVIARAVRLEAAAKPGEILVDTATWERLDRPLRVRFLAREEIRGKREEVFEAYRLAEISPEKLASVPAPEKDTSGSQKKVTEAMPDGPVQPQTIEAMARLPFPCFVKAVGLLKVASDHFHQGMTPMERAMVFNPLATMMRLTDGQVWEACKRSVSGL